MPRPPMAERVGSPVPAARTTSIRKLARILRPARMRRAVTEPESFSIPGVNTLDRRSPSSSPSLYSHSSENDSRSNLLSETDHPLLSPTSSTFSSATSEEHGDHISLSSAAKRSVSTSDLDDPLEPISPTEPSQCSSAEYTWAVDRAQDVRQGIIADKHNENDTSSLRTARVGRAKLQPLSPSEWIGSNVRSKAVLGRISSLSPAESENRSPFTSPTSSSSPPTPRPRPIYDVDHLFAKPDGDPHILNRRSYTISEISQSVVLTEIRRRPRSASEPRSFLSSAIEMSRHAGTVPSTPIENILIVPPDLDSGPASAQTILPPPRQSSLPSPTSPIGMPDDVYFTAAGRRESRIYSAPTYVPPSPMRRGHAHTSSEPLFPANDQRPPSRYDTRNGGKKEPTSGRPFEDLTRAETPSEGYSTPVSRKEEMWSGDWNRDDIQDVIRGLRSLK